MNINTKIKIKSLLSVVLLYLTMYLCVVGASVAPRIVIEVLAIIMVLGALLAVSYMIYRLFMDIYEDL